MVCNRFTRALAALALVGLTLPMMACGKQTTLDRFGSVIRTAAGGYQAFLDQQHAQGLLQDDTYARQSAKAAAILKEADAFSALISGFGSIAPGDVPAILLQLGRISAQVESALRDPAWTGANANLPAVKALRWIQTATATAALVVSALFPPPPTPVAGTASTPRAIPVAPKAASKVKVQLPPVS